VAERARLAAALEYAREGDVFVVTKLDRLARSVAHIVEITKELNRKRVTLRTIGGEVRVKSVAPGDATHPRLEWRLGARRILLLADRLAIGAPSCI
jgi:hypothetical protein